MSNANLKQFLDTIDNTAKAVTAMQRRLKSPRPVITPGMLVRPKFNMKVTLWSHYITRTCPDGVVRATMRDRLTHNLDEQALVIGVPLIKVRNNNGTGVVMLYLPTSQRFAYAWDSSLKIIVGDPNA